MAHLPNKAHTARRSPLPSEAAPPPLAWGGRAAGGLHIRTKAHLTSRPWPVLGRESAFGDAYC
eukprot:6200396-Pleurochrysis_carterae.AAC.2